MNVETWEVSRGACVTWRDGQLEISSASSGTVFRASSSELVLLLHAFATPRPVADVLAQFGASTRDQLRGYVDDLIDSGVLVKPGKDPMTIHGWERRSLEFHRASRQLSPLAAGSPRGAARAITPPEQIELGAPASAPDRDFGAVLQSRRSVRSWPPRAISRGTFSTLLQMSAGERGRRRAYPSGGGIYSLQLYPVVGPHTVESMTSGVYRYLAETHRLEVLSRDAATSDRFLSAAGRAAESAPAPLMIVITSRFSMQSRVYGELAYSLVLKEVGALMQTLNLVTTELGLGGCALGGGTPDHLLGDLCGGTTLVEPVVGEFLIGPGTD